MSADNVLGWEIVLKISHLPSKLRFPAKCSLFGQSLSRGHYQPTFQPPEGVYLLNILKQSVSSWTTYQLSPPPVILTRALPGCFRRGFKCVQVIRPLTLSTWAKIRVIWLPGNDLMHLSMLSRWGGGGGAGHRRGIWTELRVSVQMPHPRALWIVKIATKIQ